jgi:hypothetical protein
LAFQLEISESDLADLARPRLRLFLSVDVVGSTAFKHHSEKADAQGWLEFFTSFYSEFPNFLATAHSDCLQSKNLVPANFPGALLWKARGDELIFVTELTHRSQVEIQILAFRAAVGKAVTHYAHGKDPLPINFKSSAWLAGFPVGNAAIPTEAEASFVPFDFVGPAIDIGFRLGEFATPRRFAISVELASLILSCAGGGFDFHYDGKEALRGVLNGRGYPMIWIDSYKGIGAEDHHHEHALTDSEDILLNRHPVVHEKLKTFCKAYIDEIGAPLFSPFIEADPNDGLPKPPDYEEMRAKVEKRLRDVFIVGSEPNPSVLDPAEVEKKVNQIEGRLDNLPE